MLRRERDAARAVIEEKPLGLRRLGARLAVVLCFRYQTMPVSSRTCPERGIRRKSARRTLAMHPYLAELWMPFALHQIVADLINQLKVCFENFTECFSRLLKNNQPVEDRIVAARCDRIEVIFVMTRVRREVTEVNVRDRFGAFIARHLEIVRRQPVTKAAASRMHLNEERAGIFGALQLDKVIAAAEAPQLIEPAFGPTLAAPGNLPIIINRMR